MQPGARIAQKYRVLRALGEGAMGSVWAAENERTQRTFAIKLIHRSHVMADHLRERILREARACGRLRHKNVVEVYDVGETEDGDPFLVMELLEGETLEQMMSRRGPLGSRQVAAIGFQVASALGAAHEAGIIHRDLKPANIFVHEDPEHGTLIKVLDFGVSKLVVDPGGGKTTTTITGGAVGSPAYMSPEQATAKAGVDHRTDLWSVGVVLFELAAGAPAFEGSTAFAVVGNILYGPLPDLARAVPDADPRLSAIISRCLAREPAQRIGSARQLAAELEALLPASAGAVLRDLDEEPTLSREEPRQTLASGDPVWTPEPRPQRTNALGVAVVALSLLAVLTLVIVTISLVRRERPSAEVDPRQPERPPPTLVLPENVPLVEPLNPVASVPASVVAKPASSPPRRAATRAPAAPTCPPDKVIFGVDGKQRCAIAGRRVK